jgi:hypothetical protein
MSTSLAFATDPAPLMWLWDTFRIYNAFVGLLAVIALVVTRGRWYRQSRFAAIAWLALVLYSAATMFASFAAIHTATPATPRTALFTCAVTYCVVVCVMFFRDDRRIKHMFDHREQEPTERIKANKE